MNYYFFSGISELGEKSCTINHHSKLLSGDSEYDFHGADRHNRSRRGKKYSAHSRVSINHYFWCARIIILLFFSLLLFCLSLRFIKLYSRWQQRSVFFSLCTIRGHHLSSRHISTAQCHLCIREFFHHPSSKLYE